MAAHEKRQTEAKRLERRKSTEEAAMKAVSTRLQEEAVQKKKTFLFLARKYYLKWRQVTEAHKKLQANAAMLSTSSRLGVHARVREELLYYLDCLLAASNSFLFS